MAILLLPCLGVHAGTSAWITDKLEVQLRAGSGNQYRIVKLLPVGTPITVTDANETNGYVRVKLESGEDGWVFARYLSPTPIARTDMEANTKKLAALYEENQRLKAELASLKSSKEAAEKTTQEAGAEMARLSSEVTSIRQASANVLQIQNERDQLTQEKAKLEGEMEALRREMRAMDASGKQDWFMIGASVLFGGIVLGLFLPRFSWRKKTGWDSF